MQQHVSGYIVITDIPNSGSAHTDGTDQWHMEKHNNIYSAGFNYQLISTTGLN